MIICILPNISRSKCNRTMKLDQLIKCNMRNIFLENLYAKWDGETIPRTFFWKIKIIHISGSIVQGFMQFVMPSWGLLKHIETKLQTFYLPHIKLFKKIKRGLGLVSLPHFPQNLSRKIFLLLYYINWPLFIVWLPLLREILDNFCIAIVY